MCGAVAREMGGEVGERGGGWERQGEGGVWRVGADDDVDHDMSGEWWWG